MATFRDLFKPDSKPPLRRRLAAVAVALAFLALGVVVAQEWHKPAAKLPALSLDLIDGGTFDTAELSGQPLFVSFWAPDCALCIEEFPAMKRFYDGYGPQGLQVVAVALFHSPPLEVVRFSRDFGLNFPVALDPLNRVAKSFGGVEVTPTSFLYDAAGNLLWSRVGKIDFAGLEEILAKTF